MAIPEAEWHNDFAENADGSVGSRLTPSVVPQAIREGDHKHDYSQIRVPVLAFVAFPPLPYDQIRANHISDLTERTIIEAVFGANVDLIKTRIERIKSAAGGVRVVEMWNANHLVFLSNEVEVLGEMRAFAASLQ